jgi:hypothetical protein
MNYQGTLLFCLLLAVAVAGCGSKLPVDRPPNMGHAMTIREAIDAGAVSGGGAAKASVEPTGWATLSGTFKLVGAPPAPEQLDVKGGDLAVCAPGGKAVTVEHVQAGPGGGLKNVLVFLTTFEANNPAWEHESYAAQKSAVLTERPFDQKACLFMDRIYALRATQTVPLLNSDPVGHNANIQPTRGAKQANVSIPANQSVNYSPGGESPEPFPVTCSIHPWMKSWMISRNNPYFAVTGEDGSFKLENLPAAAGLKLEFRVWHESSGFIETVSLNGQPANWKKGRFELELAPDASDTLEVEIDASVFNK